MPEGLEAELYRRSAETCVGRRIVAVELDDRQQMALEISEVLPGLTIDAARRHGKLVVLDTDGPRLGLHFGMTGRLVIDGAAAIEQLEYASGRDDPAWDRLVIEFGGGGRLRINDPRRWATFTLDPDEQRLGPDFLTVDPEYLLGRFARRTIAVKAALLDQRLVAGFGNMCVDEILWQADVSPERPARSLDRPAVERLVTTSRQHLPEMLRRGGSHRGTIDPDVRASLPPCPRDGAQLRRDLVGGRTTIWCPVHQA